MVHVHTGGVSVAVQVVHAVVFRVATRVGAVTWAHVHSSATLSFTPDAVYALAVEAATSVEGVHLAVVLGHAVATRAALLSAEVRRGVHSVGRATRPGMHHRHFFFSFALAAPVVVVVVTRSAVVVAGSMEKVQSTVFFERSAGRSVGRA